MNRVKSLRFNQKTGQSPVVDKRLRSARALAQDERRGGNHWTSCNSGIRPSCLPHSSPTHPPLIPHSSATHQPLKIAGEAAPQFFAKIGVLATAQLGIIIEQSERFPPGYLKYIEMLGQLSQF